MGVRRAAVALMAVIWVASRGVAATWVVSVGVEAYGDSSINKLLYAAADATAFAHAFRATGIGDDHIQLLVSDAASSAQPTRANVLTALDRLRTRTAADDLVVFFFAGHGVDDKGQQYLLVSDTRRAMLEATSLPLSVLKPALEQLPASEVVLFVDACRNDPDAARADSDAKLTDGLARGLQGTGTRSQGAPRRFSALLACGVGERAWADPTSGHGVFTARLLDGIRQTAGADGTVKLRRLADAVRAQVTHWAARAGKRQTPTLTGPPEADPVLLVRPPEPLVSIEAANRPLAEVVAEVAQRAGLQIVLGPGADGRLRVTGCLRDQPVTVALRALTAVYGMTVEPHGEVLVLSRGTGAPVPAGDDEPPLPLPTGGELIVAPRGGHCRSIGDAVAKAPRGGVVRVRPGIYQESVTVTRPVKLIGDGPRDNIVLVSTNGPCLALRGDPVSVTGLTLLHQGLPGTADQSVVTVAEGEATLTECDLTGGSPAGAAVRGAEARLTLDRCTVRGAEVGVLADQGAQVSLQGCLCSANGVGARAARKARLSATASRFTDTDLAGLELVDAAEATVDGCGFSSSYQYGACIRDASALTMSNCQFADLPVGVFGMGEVSAILRGCRFEGMLAEGVFLVHGATVALEDCLFRSMPMGLVFDHEPAKPVVLRRCRVLGYRNHALVVRGRAVVELEQCEFRSAADGAAGAQDVKVEGDGRVVQRGAP